MQLLTVVVPKLDQLNKEGEQGRQRINQLTRYGTILVAASRRGSSRRYVESLSQGRRRGRRRDPGLGFRLMTVLTLTTGTTVIMWLGELITDQGIGNGSSLIIFAGIVAGDARRAHPLPVGRRRRRRRRPHRSLFMLLLVIGTIARDLLLRARAPPDPGPVHEATGRPKDVLGRAELPAAQDQRLRRHPADLRVVDPDVPGADREHVGLALAAGVRVGAAPGGLALQHDLHDPEHLLRVLLHRRSCSTRSTSPTTSRSRAASSRASARARTPRSTSSACCRASRSPARSTCRVVCMIPALLQKYMQVPFQLRRHRPADRRRRRARHRPADRVAPHHAQLRRLRRTEGSAHPRPRRGSSALVAARSRGRSRGRKLKSKHEIAPHARGRAGRRRDPRTRSARRRKPGVSTWELDQIARAASTSTRSTSAFLGYASPPTPRSLCTSINEVIVHGIPRKNEVLKDGDIIGIDFGIFMHGFCADTARTVMVGKVSPEKRKLVETAREALDAAIALCTVGNRLGDIGHAVQSYAESRGYSVVPPVRRPRHRPPDARGPAGPELRRGRAPGNGIKSGLVIAVEPMVNAGAPEVEVLDDDWTAVTKDRSMSAHFEHTIAITDEGPWVLTRPSSTRSRSH